MTPLLETAIVAVVHGTALAALAWILTRTILRRARPAVIAALWTVVLVKFVVPVGPGMPYSISDLIEGMRGDDAVAAAPPIAADATAATLPAPSTMSAVIEAGTWIAVAIWLAVAVALAIRTIRSSRATRAMVRALPGAPRVLVDELDALASRLGAPRAALRIGGESPRVVGLVEPTIVLPARLAAGDAADRGAILSHELAHLRRRDLWVGAIQAIAGVALWWWPVVGWVGRRLGAAREAACDAWALDRGPLPREQYARLLLSLARGTRAPGMAFAASRLSERVDAILDRRARAGLGPAGLAIVGGFAVVGLAGAHPPDAATAAEPCIYDRDSGASILAAYPHADRDGDGQLTRDEACDFQAELAAKSPTETLALAGDGVSEPICCNCPGSEGTSSAPALEPISSCVEGVTP